MITFSVHINVSTWCEQSPACGRYLRKAPVSAVIMGLSGRIQGMFGRTKVTALLAGWMKRKETETKDSPNLSGSSNWEGGKRKPRVTGREVRRALTRTLLG